MSVQQDDIYGQDPERRSGHDPEQSSGRDPEQGSGQSPEQLIRAFYDHFSRRDWKGMVNCYHKDVFFYDPVFQNLEGPEVSAMWEMLLSGAKDLIVTAGDVTMDGDYGSCNWIAVYTFSATGRKVENKGRARMRIGEDRIAEHYDEFNFWHWSRQALGLPGLLFGWTPTLRRKVQRQARKRLDKFIAAKNALFA